MTDTPAITATTLLVRDPHERESDAGRHDEQQEPRRRSAEGDSKAKLARALRRHIRDHAVQAHRGEAKRDGAEDNE